jgi:hypothetical protein
MNMKRTQPELIDEVTRYLAAVELFRSLGCEPVWRPESTRPQAADEPLLATAATARPPTEVGWTDWQPR